MSTLTCSTIVVSGADALEFLQRQLTNDLGLLDSEAEILAAWCNPKGRVIWFGTVTATESGYALSVPTAMAEDIVERLKVFRFRSKVDFVIDEGGSIDPAFLIQNGYVFIDHQQTEQFTPHMLNLDLIGAISLDKGCYPGQEIVARTHYRGATKRRCLRFRSDEPLNPGDKISDGTRDVGEVVNACGNELLAVVPVEMREQELTSNGSGLVALPLPYLQ